MIQPVQIRFSAQPKLAKPVPSVSGSAEAIVQSGTKPQGRFFPPEIPPGLEVPTQPKTGTSLKMLFSLPKKDAQANTDLMSLMQTLKQLDAASKIRLIDPEPFVRLSEQRYAPLVEIDGQQYTLTQGMRTKTGRGWVQNSAYFTLKRTDGRIELDYTYGQETYYRDNELGIKLKGNSKELVQLGAEFQNILSRLLSEHSQGQYSREVQAFEQDIKNAKLLDY